MLKKAEDFLLFLTLLFLPTQLGKHFWPSFSYIFSLKVDFLSPTVYFWDLLVIVLILTWILQRSRINKWALNLWLIFMLTQFASLVGAQNLGVGLVRLEQYMISGLFGVYIASYDFKKLSKKIYLPLALGIAGESVIVVLQFIKGATLGLWILGERTFTISTPAIAKFDFYGLQFLRPYATFPHPNVLAGYLLTVVILLKKRIRWWLVLFAGIGVLLTMSRTAIAAGLVSGAFLLRKKWLILAGVLLLVISPILFTRFSSVFNFDNLTILRREELIVSAWQLFLRHPLVGIGLNNFIPAMADNLTAGPSRFLQPVHNIFFLALAETGIVGLVGLVCLLGIPILSSLRKSFDPEVLRTEGQGSIQIIYGSPVKSGMTAVWFIMIFLGMFDHYFLTLPQGYRLLFLVWGLSLSMLKCSDENFFKDF